MMKRRRFLQLAAGAAAGAVIRPASGQEVFMTIGGGKPGLGEALRVRCGERVLFHFRHAGGSEDVLLHLSGHRFTVIALDGIAVPTRAAVDVLSLTAGERIDAMVEMNAPGNWLLGSLDDAARAGGLGIVVGYKNYNGPPRWLAPAAVDWHYGASAQPVAWFQSRIRRSRWCSRINGSSTASPFQISTASNCGGAGVIGYA
jgi:hypothetical protein